MQIIPAIDLRGGKCVRLRQGDYAQETVFGDDPVAVASRWVEKGADYLHVVDLDGAREGHPIHGQTVRAIVRSCGVPCQLGGGVRSEADIEETLGWGVDRVVLGTRAFEDPDWLLAMARAHAGRLVLGLDARNGRVSTRGWLHDSELWALEAARACSGWPLGAIVYTDIGRDGMLAGPNYEALEEMVRTVSLPVIASGGVTTIEDIRRLAGLNVAGCIVGRALYEGRLDLAEALRVVHGSS